MAAQNPDQSQPTRKRKPVVTFLEGFLRSFWTDPVIFLTVFAPYLMGAALGRSTGAFAIAGNVEIVNFLSSPATAGVVDFTISFYTALIAWAMFSWRAGTVAWSYSTRPKTSSDGDVPCLSFLLSFTVMLVAGLWIFVGGNVTDGLLQEYVDRAVSVKMVLGQTYRPLATEIFAIRICIGFLTWWMIYIATTRSWARH